MQAVAIKVIFISINIKHKHTRLSVRFCDSGLGLIYIGRFLAVIIQSNIKANTPLKREGYDMWYLSYTYIKIIFLF